MAHLGTIWEKICNLSLHQTTQVKRLIPSWACQQSAYWALNVSCAGSGGGMFLAHTCRSVSRGATTPCCLAARAHYVPVPCGPSARAWGFCCQRMREGRGRAGKGVLGLPRLWMLSLRPWWERLPTEPCTASTLRIAWDFVRVWRMGYRLWWLWQRGWFWTNLIVLNWSYAYFLGLGCAYFKQWQ